MKSHPRSGCSSIVFDGEKVLLIKRGKPPYEGRWSLPGGAQEFGETLEQCALRELREETGLKASSATFLITRDRMQFDDNGNPTFHYVLTTFLVEAFSGELVAGDDAQDAQWFTLAEMDELQTTPETPSFVRKMLGKPES